MFHFCYCASSTLLINVMQWWFCYSLSIFTVFLLSDAPSVLPWGWRRRSVGILLDPRKQILLKPYGIHDLLEILCWIQDSPEGIHAVEAYTASGISCALDLQHHHHLRAPVLHASSHTQVYCVQSVLLYWRSVYYQDIGSDWKVYST